MDRGFRRRFQIFNKPGFGIADRQYVAALRGARGFMAQLAEGFALDRTAMGSRLKLLGTTEYANETAVDQLRDWGKATGAAAEFLHVGKTTKIGSFIPGVEFEVLSPPLPTIYPNIAKQVADHDKEFWHLWQQRFPMALDAAASLAAAEAGGRASASGRRRRSGVDDAPGEIGPVRWLTEKVRRQQVASLLRVVTWLDDVMNNTSVVLLIKAGNRQLLFPGDAQLKIVAVDHGRLAEGRHQPQEPQEGGPVQGRGTTGAGTPRRRRPCTGSGRPPARRPDD